MIENRVEDDRQLTIHICTGAITADHLMQAISDLYDGEPTPNHLWDLREADVSGMSGSEVKEIAFFAKRYAPDRKGGKTAIVSPADVAFGLSRAYEVFADMAHQQVAVRAFRSLEDAERWLAS